MMYRHLARLPLSFLLPLLLPLPTKAGDQSPQSWMTMSFEELLSVKVDTASAAFLNQKHQPAVVTLISAREIREMGAQYLMDILARVPGFNFAGDVNGSVGASFRGIWAYEGKLLFLLDDLPVVDLLYGNVPLLRRFPAELIEHIEIIRGPGAVRYGNNAECAVVKIYTRKSTEGSEVWITSRATVTTVARSLTWNTGFDSAIGRGTLSANITRDTLSDGTYIGLEGWRADLSHHSDVSNANINAHWKSDVFEVQYLFEDYDVQVVDFFGTRAIGPTWISTSQQAEGPFTVSFSTHVASADFHIINHSDWNVSYHIIQQRQNPWRFEDKYGSDFFDIEIDKQRHEIAAEYKLDEMSQVNIGIEHATLNAHVFETNLAAASHEFGAQGSDLTITENSGYVEFIRPTKSTTLALGARWADREDLGSEVLPRAALSIDFEEQYLKFAFSKAFRNPDIQNMFQPLRNEQGEIISDEVKREVIDSREIEWGYKIDDHTHFSLNLFSASLKDALVYRSTSDATAGYINSQSNIGSSGLEAIFRMERELWYIEASLAYYKATDNDEVNYRPEPKGDTFISAPAHKTVVKLHKKLTDNLSVSLSTYRNSRFYAYSYNQQTNSPRLEQQHSETISDATLSISLETTKIQLGITNIFNSQKRYYQAFNGTDSGIPQESRALFIKIGLNY